MTDRNIFKTEDVLFIMGAGVILTGKLNNGILKKGMKATINGKISEVLKIESQKQSIELLNIGVPAGLSLSNISKDDIQRGSEYYFK